VEPLGINLGLFAIQLVVAFGWIGLGIFSLFSLRNRKLTGITLAVWVLVICSVPVLGALAYWIVQPSGEDK